MEPGSSTWELTELQWLQGPGHCGSGSGVLGVGAAKLLQSQNLSAGVCKTTTALGPRVQTHCSVCFGFCGVGTCRGAMDPVWSEDTCKVIKGPLLFQGGHAVNGWSFGVQSMHGVRVSGSQGPRAHSSVLLSNGSAVMAVG